MPDIHLVYRYVLVDILSTAEYVRQKSLFGHASRGHITSYCCTAAAVMFVSYVLCLRSTSKTSKKKKNLLTVANVLCVARHIRTTGLSGRYRVESGQFQEGLLSFSAVRATRLLFLTRLFTANPSEAGCKLASRKSSSSSAPIMVNAMKNDIPW